MRTFDRLLVLGSSFVFATLLLFLFGTFLGYLLLIPGLIYLIIGGKKHV